MSIRAGALGAVAATALALGLLAAAPASAAYERVDCFAGGTEADHCAPLKKGEGFSEEVQLGGTGGMAVNYTGTGGVPAGTVYAATRGPSSGTVRVAMFTPKVKPSTSELELEFALSWEVTVSEGPYERCGPGLPSPTACAPRVEAEPGKVDVDVDQATGNVYAYNATFTAGRNAIAEYDARGSKVITRFGELAPSGKTTAETPSLVHDPYILGGLAVNEAGEVYIYDTNNVGGEYHRLMKFRPKAPGKYDEYEYAGTSEDLGAGFKNEGRRPLEPVTDAAGDVYVAPDQSHVEKYDASKPGDPPVCDFAFAKGGITAITVDPATGTPFFFTYKPPKRLYQLGPCNTATGEFEGGIIGETIVSPERDDLWGLAFDPVAQYSPSRPAGVLYGGAPNPVPNSGVGEGEKGQSSLGYIFAPPEENPPEVGAESVSAVSEASARLSAQLDPKGSKTHYAFQYIAEGAYQANEPDELQSLTVSATGGLFGLGLEGARLGGPALGDLSAGSATVSSLKTATATATLKAAKGAGNLNGAIGKGTVISGSNTITSLAVGEGSFEVGQGISGEGIPQGATITAIATEAPLSTLEVTISAVASKSLAHVKLSAGTKTITSLSTSEGTFEAGQQISGSGILADTTIIAATPTELTLSNPVFGPATAVALKAGSTKLTSVVTGIGSFAVGATVQGEGIPAGAKVTAVGSGELTLSQPAEKPGSGVAISDPGPAPLAIGEAIEGPGIPPGATIAAASPGQLTLSATATASAAAVPLKAGLQADIGAAALRQALEALPTIGTGGVEVSGGPGDESGSSPYEILFTGALENVDVAELTATDLSLSGGAASIEAQTLNDGGNGFAKGASEAPPGGADLEGGAGPQSVAVTLTGLSPDTTYRYRALATSHCSPGDAKKVCEDTGPTEAFHTHPAEEPGPHDNRAFELVSPAQKHGGQVLPAEPGISSCGSESDCKPGDTFNHFPMQSEPNGDAVVYEGTSFAPGTGIAQGNSYIARRDPVSGWQSVNLSPPLLRTEGRGYRAFDEALSKGLFGQTGPALSPAAPPEFKNLYIRQTASPFALSPLLSAEPPNRPATESGAFEAKYAGAAADLSRIFFTANDALTEEAPGIAPAAEDGGATKFNLYEWEEASGQLRLVNVFPGNATTEAGASIGVPSTGAVSADGSRVFWSDQSGQLYVREDAALSKEIPDSGKFLSASRDGSKVLLDNGHLYDLGTEAITDLSGGKGGFQGISGQSEDLSRIYFVDDKVLSGEEENSFGAKAEAGELNLYAWSEEGPTRYVATLLASDNNGSNLVRGASWSPLPSQRTAEASPGGRYLAFLSQAQITGFDNTGQCESNHAGGFIQAPCPEVFLYDSGAETLFCASCNRSGAGPLGLSSLRLIRLGEDLPQPRYLTDSGRLYFDSQDTLNQFDTNDGVEDVYEFKPEGAGGCEREGGCTTLISSGHDSSDANLLAVDQSGKNVFFTTRNRLVNADEDELIDLYDAREGGVSFESPPQGACQGEGCQPTPPPSPQAPPASSTLTDPGNVKQAAPCKKNRVKRHGRCVAKQKPKKRGAKGKKAKHAPAKSGGGE